jgi:hypothetical protein
MRADTAADHLRKLREAASEASIQSDTSESLTWKQNVRSIFVKALGSDHHLVTELDDIRYGLSFVTSSTPASAWANAYRGGIAEAASYIDAAIFELELSEDSDVPLDDLSYDPELLLHVKNTIESGDWDKLAAQVAIFVEDKVRRWSESPDTLVGKGLYASALADDAELRLGKTKSEWEGWRFLGMGLAQAVGNVDRHRLQNRGDAKRYAIGVLGVGSLLLTQLRFEHEEIIQQRNI